MALTPEEQARLEELEKLIGSGAKNIQWEGGGVRRELETHSYKDLQTERARLEAKKLIRPRRSLITYSRGR